MSFPPALRYSLSVSILSLFSSLSVFDSWKRQILERKYGCVSGWKLDRGKQKSTSHIYLPSWVERMENGAGSGSIPRRMTLPLRSASSSGPGESFSPAYKPTCFILMQTFPYFLTSGHISPLSWDGKNRNSSQRYEFIAVEIRRNDEWREMTPEKESSRENKNRQKDKRKERGN